MSAQLAQLQEDRGQYQEQLDLVVSSLNDDPGNDELLALKAELESALEIIDASISELKPEHRKKAATPAAAETPTAPSATAAEAAATTTTSKASATTHDDAPVVYKVNESILARWVTGDKGFYPARIMSVTGSATAPMYTVKFKSYDTIETLRARDIRPLAPANSSSSATSSAATKRKADGSSATPLSPSTSTPTPPPPSSSSSSSALFFVGTLCIGTTPAATASTSPWSAATATSTSTTAIAPGVVSSASPQLYTQPPQRQQQQHQQWPSGSVANVNSTGGSSSAASGSTATNATPLGEEPPVKKFKKIKATKQLEAGKSKWQEFSSKGKTGKPGNKKDSMFRTPDGPQGRVGFIGSGQAMRKDVTRSRHIYQTNDDVD
ncbi:hypothetical protein SPBR_05936 [Sporothrix brasiliensis 5110]|uniref:Tudor domain-containing protein n=1 Tax=Sporothrix brasiliensis 5110 TaxID=1398154 RepID=A0A0C2FT46_9PEZI|nr:uncharacterized protein SPBR_05936 [Sporothrix brasiliensis 5110]KIH94173.1 hypothetical protein SPBR_05936 [Sporothrix brasiliensis 5110]